ncbi:N-acetyltransferase [Rhizobium leguminosarum]|uniref:N-acetyltransferase n=1 Tax=Rhizobium leguminosarum TaxID=384 RepID=UPI001FEF88AB|nr:N-acetyltransferase [Rhizobium leguminosarum]
MADRSCIGIDGSPIDPKIVLTEFGKILDTDYRKVPPEELIEVRAFIDLFEMAPKAMLDREQFDCVELSEGLAISLPSAPAVGLNRILGLRDTGDLDTAFNWMSRKSGRRFLQIDDGAISEEIGQWIADRALVEEGSGWVKLIRPAPAAALPGIEGVTVRRAVPRDAELAGSLMCDGFGFPRQLGPIWSATVSSENWVCLLAEVDGQVVGTGLMFMAEGLAWLGAGTTIPQYRNRGVQKAIIQGRLNLGMAHGVSIFVVETAHPEPGNFNASFNNLTNTRFKRVYSRRNLRLPD